MYFNYQAVTPADHVVHESTEAGSAGILGERLEKQGFQVVEIRIDWRRSLASGFRRPSIKRSVLVDFFSHLKGMLELGMNVTTALTTVKETMDERNLRRALNDMDDMVTKGYSLSEAMAQTEMFPPLVVASVSAAEKANRLEHVFNELGEHYARLEELAANAKKAAMYPLISIVILSLIMLMMLLFIIPQLKDVLPGEKPLLTRILIGLSESIQYIWWIPPALVGGVFFGYRNLNSSQKAKVGERLYKLPLIGRIALNLSLSTLFMSLAMLNGGGIPLLESLKIATTTTTSPFIRNKVSICRELAAQGSPLSEGFKDPLFPAVVLRAIAHGEATGRFDKQFAGIAKYLRERTSNQLAVLSSFIEPALILVGGGMLLLMALGIFAPIYGNLKNMGR
jgi:type II secretory pathway component PulF